jgi:hypothetical protein
MANESQLYDWLRFINAETEEELNEVANRNPHIARAAEKLRKMSADPEVREMYALRQKALQERELEEEARQVGQEE